LAKSGPDSSLKPSPPDRKKENNFAPGAKLFRGKPDRFEKSVAVAAAAVTTGTAVQILGGGNPAEFNRFADVLLHKVLQLVHFLLRIQKGGGNGVFQQGVALLLEAGDFRRFQRLAVVLFFLERLAFAHDAFILAARRGIRQKRINALANSASFNVFDNGFAKLTGFVFDFR
jgi:hypothetical protein